MELENNPTPVETLDMPMGSDSYAPLPQQGRRLRNFGRFARKVPVAQNFINNFIGCCPVIPELRNLGFGQS